MISGIDPKICIGWLSVCKELLQIYRPGLLNSINNKQNNSNVCSYVLM